SSGRGVHPPQLPGGEEEWARDSKSEVHVGPGNLVHHLFARAAWAVAVGARRRADEVHIPPLERLLADTPLRLGRERPRPRHRVAVDDEERQRREAEGLSFEV